MGKREGGMGEEGTGMRGEGWDREERREGGIGIRQGGVERRGDKGNAQRKRAIQRKAWWGQWYAVGTEWPWCGL